MHVMYKRQQRIRELLAEVAELERLEAVEQSMVASGWSVLPDGGFRRPAPSRPYNTHRSEEAV